MTSTMKKSSAIKTRRGTKAPPAKAPPRNENRGRIKAPEVAKETPEAKTQPRQRSGKRWDAHTVRRRIQHVREGPSGLHAFGCYSMTRTGREVRHRQEINLNSGEVRCSCENFGFRFAAHSPHLLQTDRHCKHIAPCLEWLVRHGHLARSFLNYRLCTSCNGRDAEHQLADENGEPTAGYICEACVAVARNEEGDLDLRF